MDKNAFKIICDLIYKQLITYDEAQVLIEAIMEKPSTLIANPVNLKPLNEDRTDNPNIWPEPGTNPYKDPIYPQRTITWPYGSVTEPTFDSTNESTTVSGTAFNGFSNCCMDNKSDKETK